MPKQSEVKWHLQEGYEYTGTGAGYTVDLFPSKRYAGGRRSEYPVWHCNIKWDAGAYCSKIALSEAGILNAIKRSNLLPTPIAWEQGEKFSDLPFASVRGAKDEIRDGSWHPAESDLIYFIESTGSGRIKVGWAGNIISRLETLYAVSPFPLRILALTPGTRKDEAALHRRFAHLRVHREWFQDCDELREYIASL